MGKLRGVVDILDDRLDSVPDLIAVDENAHLDFDELFALGEMASLALAQGAVDSEDAQYLYEIHSDFNNRSLAERVMYMQFAAVFFEEMKNG